MALEILKTAYEGLTKVKKALNAVEVNNKSCSLLKARLDAIEPGIEAILKGLEHGSANMNEDVLVPPLERLISCIDEVNHFVKQFMRDDTSQSVFNKLVRKGKKVYNHAKDKEAIIDFIKRFEDCAADLNLGLTIDARTMRKELDSAFFEDSKLLLEELKQGLDGLTGKMSDKEAEQHDQHQELVDAIAQQKVDLRQQYEEIYREKIDDLKKQLQEKTGAVEGMQYLLPPFSLPPSTPGPHQLLYPPPLCSCLALQLLLSRKMR
jgi:hypothetical protein